MVRNNQCHPCPQHPSLVKPPLLAAALWGHQPPRANHGATPAAVLCPRDRHPAHCSSTVPHGPGPWYQLETLWA